MTTARDAWTEIPTLAACAGVYREWPVTGPLSKLFRRSWSHVLPVDLEGAVLVVPDGCADLIWSGNDLLVVGPDRTAAFPRLASGGTILGLRFRPGAALRWLDVPLQELVGRTVPLRNLRSDAESIEEQLVGERNPTTRQRLFHAWALRQAETSAGPHSGMEALFDNLDNATHDLLSGNVMLGERTLRRQSHDHFGYGPKRLGRILRFQRFMRLVRTPSPGNLAILALEAGYADQAHMTRDVREFTTLTPQHIRRQFGR